MKSIFRSWKSSYFHGDILNAPRVYTGEELRRIADAGHTGIFVHGLLRDISRSDVFPELNRKGYRSNIKSLRILTERAARSGIDVFVYLVEPRCLSVSDPFWKKHPHLRGTTRKSEMLEYPEGQALCTSEAETFDFLENSSANLFRAAPALKGLVLVTASEHLHHCLCFSTPVWPEIYEKQYPNLCPRCRDRNPVEIVSAIINRLNRGARSARPDAEIIASAWDWNWYDPVPHAKIIRALDRNVAILVDFEIGGTKHEKDGTPRTIREYALSYVGPSERCVRYARFLRRTKRAFHLKMVLGTTHELTVVPCLPVPTQVYEKLQAAQKLKPAGLMGWTFGTIPCVNLKVQEKFLKSEVGPENRKDFMKNLADEFFPGGDPKAIVRAWEYFVRAIELYPHDNTFLYRGPVNYALAYRQYPGPVQGKPMPATWLDLPHDGDDLSSCCKSFGEKEIIRRFKAMAAYFKQGLVHYRKGLRNVDTDTKRKELANAEIIPLVFLSVANILRIHLLKKSWKQSSGKSFLKLAQDEIALCRQAVPLIRQYPLLGHHIEADTHMFSEKLIRRKIRHYTRLSTQKT